MYLKTLICSLTILTMAKLACATCTVSQNSGLSFACPLNQYSNCNSTAQLAITCTSATPFTLTLNQGLANNFIPRQMIEPVHNYRVNYNIYLDANKNQIFGDGTQGTSVLSTTCSGTCSYNLYGFIQSSVVKAGNYSDVTILTINY